MSEIFSGMNQKTPDRKRTRFLAASRRRARGWCHLSGSLFLFFVVRVFRDCFFLFDRSIGVCVCMWNGARAGPSRRSMPARTARRARVMNELHVMGWDCRARARTGVRNGRDANGGIETRSNDRSTTRERERERGTRRRDRTRVSFAPPRIVIVDSWCEITIRATVEDGRGG